MTNRVINILAFGVLTLLWLVFVAALLFNGELLNTAWQSLRTWPLAGQLVVWLLVLPVTLGLWIWQTPWPIWLRLILVAGLAWGTIYLFFPRKTRNPAEVSSAKS